MGATFCVMVGLLVGLACLKRLRWWVLRVPDLFDPEKVHVFRVSPPGPHGDFFSPMEGPGERLVFAYQREPFEPAEGLLPEMSGLVGLFGKTSR